MKARLPERVGVAGSPCRITVRAQRSAGYVMSISILSILMMLVGATTLVSLAMSRQRGSNQLSSSRDARDVAEAGVDRIIATFNQPENRRLLVSGMAMPDWRTVAATSLISPCIRTDGTRPGPNRDGLPSAVALSYGEGRFHDLETGELDRGERRFSLRSITYASGANGNNDRRSIRITSQAGSSTLTEIGGDYSDALINLDDPDGTGPKSPGFNQGYVTLTVEGRVVRANSTVATAVVTREFHVVPKCCGASFGSNGSGGRSLGDAAASLGSDSRVCAMDMGVITGLNGGTHWSLFANDNYTTLNAAGQVVPLRQIIGDVTSNTVKTFSRSNCRVIPCASSTGQDGTSWNDYLRNARPGGATGSASDIAGTSISGIPVIAANLNLTPVSSFYHSFSSRATAALRPSYTTSEYLRTNQTTRAVERRFPNTAAGFSACRAANNSTTCAFSNGFYWARVASCDYALQSPGTWLPGFHCKGPSVDFSGSTSGQSLVVDTTDGPLTFYYNTAAGWGYVNAAQPLIRLGSGDAFNHVQCQALSGSCATPVMDTSYSRLGVPDRLNIFGNEYSGVYPAYLQQIFLNATSVSSTDPGKVTGVWIYMPTGLLDLRAALGGSCTPTRVDCWNVHARIWVKSLKAYGDLVFRVPPSFGNYVQSSPASSDVAIVPWSGVDWVARSVSVARNY